ncbi:MAG: site-2 protease family protein [Planctomycetota bacterium]|nr:MAG: site-2 protease family protein [Planctomycetota bacterium]
MDFVTIAAIVLGIFSLTTHEAAHAWAADRFGDPTAKSMGRMTLNPLVHIDPFMTILLPFLTFMTSNVIFGGAKPVPVNLFRLRNRWLHWALVGAAGPVSNFLLATACAALLALLLRFGVYEVRSSGAMVLSFGIVINVFLGSFNLIPIPPLDGSRVVQYFLNDQAREQYHKVERFGLFIILGLFFFTPFFLYFQVYVLEPLLNFFGSTFNITEALTVALNSKR